MVRWYTPRAMSFRSTRLHVLDRSGAEDVGSNSSAGKQLSKHASILQQRQSGPTQPPAFQPTTAAVPCRQAHGRCGGTTDHGRPQRHRLGMLGISGAGVVGRKGRAMQAVEQAYKQAAAGSLDCTRHPPIQPATTACPCPTSAWSCGHTISHVGPQHSGWGCWPFQGRELLVGRARQGRQYSKNACNLWQVQSATIRCSPTPPAALASLATSAWSVWYTPRAMSVRSTRAGDAGATGAKGLVGRAGGAGGQ
jgi:hypothetical protein